MSDNIDINIDSLRQTAQNQRSQSQGRRLEDYILARDELFNSIIKNAKEKMSAAAEAGHYRAILMSGRRQEDGLYPSDMFFGANDLDGRKGIPFPSVWNPTGISEDQTLLSKLRRSFQVDKNQNLRFYVKRDLRNSLHFHVFVDWSPRYRNAVSTGTPVRPSSNVANDVNVANVDDNPVVQERKNNRYEREGGYIQPRSKTNRNPIQIDDDGFILAVPNRRK